MSIFDNNIADTQLTVKDFYYVKFIRGSWDILSEDYELIIRYFYKYAYNNDFYSAVKNIKNLIGNMPVELFNDYMRTGNDRPLKKKFKKLIKRSWHQYFKFIRSDDNSLSILFTTPIKLVPAWHSGEITIERYFSFDLLPL